MNSKLTLILDSKLNVMPPITASLQGILKAKNISENLYKHYLEEKYELKS